MTQVETRPTLELILVPERVWYELTRRVTERFFRMRDSVPPSLEPRLSKAYGGTLKRLPPIGFSSIREYHSRMEEWTAFHLGRIAETIPNRGMIDERDRDRVQLMVQLQILSHMIARAMTAASVDVRETRQQVLQAGEFQTINGLLMMLEETTDHGRRDRELVFPPEAWQRMNAILEGNTWEEKLAFLQQRFEETLPPLPERIYDRLTIAYAKLGDQTGVLSIQWGSTALDRLIAQ